MEDRGYSDSEDVVSDGNDDSLSHGSSQDMFTFSPFKSLGFEASSSRNVDNGHGNFRKLKKAKNLKPNGANPSTADEMNFALDGLSSGQSLRIRRTSLLSLLSICATIQQRRSFRSHGMAKPIIDAILGLNLDDPPSNLAAAALFHVLTSDDQGDRILDSPSCIHFLIKLLNQHSFHPGKIQGSSIGNRVLAVGSSRGVDCTSSAIVQKVEEMLDVVNSSNGNVYSVRKLEQRAKWIALLTIEKACSSPVSNEDPTISGRKSGGNFKEKFGEFGGLDTVFEIIRDCHSILERWLKHASSKNKELKENADPESLLLLLKCLKVVENATIFSKTNQDHLLGLRGSLVNSMAPESFIKLIISVIRILSGFSLLDNSMDSESLLGPSAWVQTENVPFSTANGAERDGNMIGRCASTDCTSISSRKKFGIPESSLWLSARCSGKPKSTSDATTTSGVDSFMWRRKTNGVSNSFEFEKPELLEDGQDPFAFDELDFKPSKWEGHFRGQVGKKIQYGPKRLSRNGQMQRESISNHLKPDNHGNNHPDVSSSSAFDEETQNLLADCLLNAVKALMNVTNENPLGCSQIAANGGLEILTILLAGLFPLFAASSAHLLADTSKNTSLVVEVGSKSDTRLSDRELNLLVAILGLLVNLVEKDGHVRLRLAEAVIPLPPRLKEMEKKRTHGNVVPLLCSIFLENQGAGEAAEEAKVATINWDDEEAILQGEKEAEKMIVEAYAALLLAFLSTQNKEIRNAIIKCLPDNNLAVLVPVLERFVEFHRMMGVISMETYDALLEVIESCRL